MPNVKSDEITPQERELIERIIKQAGWWTVGLISFGCIVPLVAMMLFVRATEPDNEALGLLLAYLAASVVVGGGLGFLFGVPRVVDGDDPKDKNRPNSNLEQISDWLTKVLVGATLTQVGQIPRAATALFVALGTPLGVGGSGVAFAGAVTVYGVVFGFCAAWISTRGWLDRMLEAIDCSAQEIAKFATTHSGRAAGASA
jgi:hypothetical protein